MSSLQMEKVLNLYKQLHKIPSLASAKIFSGNKNLLTLQCIWTQRSFERKTKQKFMQEFSFNKELQLLIKSFPRDVTTELLTTSSKDEKLKAILRDATLDGKSKQFIEIWDQQHIIKTYDLSAYDVHGDVYTEPTFSAFHWSPDNTRLLYVAEKKLSKSEPYFVQKPKKNKADEEKEPTKGTEYIYKPDWGEQLVGKHRSVVVILNVNEDTIVTLDSIPDDFFPAQVIWAPNGEDVVGVAHKLNTRYLGLYACSNRESYIFHLKGTEFNKLTAEGLACMSPRFSPDGKNLIWYEREISPAHRHVLRLMRLKWNESEKPDTLIDAVKTSINIANNKKFYGIYEEFLPCNCWSSDSKYIFFSTSQRSNIKSYIINIETRVITEIDYSDGSSLLVTDVNENFIAFKSFSVIKSHQLLISKFDSNVQNLGCLTFIECSKPFDITVKEKISYEHTEFVYSNTDPIRDFNFTYFGKTNEPNQSVPLIVALHGGPHASYCNLYIPTYALFTLLGFGVLQINYRGSTGLGGDNIDYLLGKVGEVDVLDCITAIDESLKKYPWLNPSKIHLYGGSHGGFLGAHLSGQYPDKFKSVIMINPVIDIAAMFSATDIPDWCRAVSGYSYLEKLPIANGNEDYYELIHNLLKHSPILHVDKVKTPTLIALGSKDLRVPPFQGKLWYNRLIMNNVTTKLYVYEDNHSILKDEFAIDNDINCVLWFLEKNDE